jgi:hypothetical protein
MNRKLIALTALLLTCLGTQPVLAQSCGRSCLASAAEAYMKAVVNNDKSLAKLSAGYRQTENTSVTRVGTGVWGRFSETAAQSYLYTDEITGQVLWFGTLQSNERTEVAMVRIKVEELEITEAEWFYTAPGLAGMNGPPTTDGTGALFSNPEFVEQHPPIVRVVPPSERLTRAALRGIANSYFDGLTENDGSLVLAHPDCYRAENGVLVTGRPLGEGKTDGYEGKTNCNSNFGNFNISNVSARRFPIIDEEQQVVVTSAMFMRNANGFQRRCVFIELFYIDEGYISSIYSVIYYPDPGQPAPNWEPYDGNFPLPESFGEAR